MTETELKKQRYRDKIRKLREELAKTEGFLKKIDRDEKDAWLKSVVTMVEQYFRNKDAATKVPAAETAQ